MAGTYPVELSPEFVFRIRWRLPLAYTVNAFRSTIAGGESIQRPVIVMAVTAIVFTGLTILLFMKRAKNIRENKKEPDSFLKANGLAWDKVLE